MDLRLDLAVELGNLFADPRAGQLALLARLACTRTQLLLEALDAGGPKILCSKKLERRWHCAIRGRGDRSPDLFRRVLEVNTVGLYTCTRAAARVMLDRGAGSIVNVASISGLVAGDGLDTPSYTASKGAVVNLTRELAVRWAPRGVASTRLRPDGSHRR